MTTCTSSSFSRPEVATTEEIPPGAPVGVAVISITENQVVIGWAEPQQTNGNILRYRVGRNYYINLTSFTHIINCVLIFFVAGELSWYQST